DQASCRDDAAACGQRAAAPDLHIPGVVERAGRGDVRPILNGEAARGAVAAEVRQRVGAVLIDDGGGRAVEDDVGRVRLEVGVIELERALDQVGAPGQSRAAEVGEPTSQVDGPVFDVEGAGVVEGDGELCDAGSGVEEGALVVDGIAGVAEVVIEE